MPYLPSDDESPLAGTEVHYLRSEHVGDEFKIFVGHCGGSEGAAPVVLYVTDANGMFASAVDIVRLMQLSAHLPPILVVGIGYRMGALGDTVGVRTRDFTPTSDPLIARISPGVTVMGGAERFLAFIREELQPWVQSRYRVDADGLRLLRPLARRAVRHLRAAHRTGHVPQVRHRQPIAVVGRRHDVRLRSDLRRRRHDDLPAKVFFAVGAFEDHDGRQREASRLPADERAKAGLRYIDMVADTERMVSIAAQAPATRTSTSPAWSCPTSSTSPCRTSTCRDRCGTSSTRPSRSISADQNSSDTERSQAGPPRTASDGCCMRALSVCS